MKPEIKRHNYIHFGLQATFLYLTFNFLRALLHELGHGTAALCTGLEFKGFYAAVFGSSGAWINGARSPFQSVVISSAGPMVDLIIGLVILFIIFPHLKKWSSQLPFLLLASSTLISFWGLMMSTGFGAGDFANVAYSLGIPKMIFGILGIIGLIAFLSLLTERMLFIASEYFIFKKFSQRFSIIFLFLGLPMLVFVTGFALLTSKYEILGQAIFVIGILILIVGFNKSTSQKSDFIPSFPTYSGITAFIVTCLIWLILYGPTLHKARGIFFE